MNENSVDLLNLTMEVKFVGLMSINRHGCFNFWSGKSL